MRLRYYIILVFLIISCKNKQDSNPVQDIKSEEDIPSDFMQFYIKFHSDSTYQLDNILFPIEKTPDGGQWTQENWVTHTPFDDMGGQFQQSFKNFNGMIIEYIRDEVGYFSLEKRYIKSSDGYKLMYYHIINAFEGNEEWQQE